MLPLGAHQPAKFPWFARCVDAWLADSVAKDPCLLEMLWPATALDDGGDFRRGVFRWGLGPGSPTCTQDVWLVSRRGSALVDVPDRFCQRKPLWSTSDPGGVWRAVTSSSGREAGVATLGSGVGEDERPIPSPNDEDDVERMHYQQHQLTRRSRRLLRDDDKVHAEDVVR